MRKKPCDPTSSAIWAVDRRSPTPQPLHLACKGHLSMSCADIMNASMISSEPRWIVGRRTMSEMAKGAERTHADAPKVERYHREAVQARDNACAGRPLRPFPPDIIQR